MSLYFVCKERSRVEVLTVEKVIEESRAGMAKPAPPTRRPHRRRRFPLGMALLLDVVLAGALLCLFALPHHVLPRSYQAVEPPATTPTVPDTEPEDDPDTSLGSHFAEKFTASVIRTDSSYSSPQIAFTVQQYTQGEGNHSITYYVADIYLRSVQCFRTAMAKDTFGKGVSEPMADMAANSNALLAISGDYYGRHYGPVIRNGVLYRDTAGSGDVCVLYQDGTLKTFAKGTFSAQTEMENGAWQAWCFGPSLLDSDGHAKTSFNSSLTAKHPRCALGYYEPGHYAFVLVDGRQEGYSEGMTLAELSSLFESLGCTVAYNLDGGRSAQMTYNGDFVNHPYKDGREISDILFIGEAEEP